MNKKLTLWSITVGLGGLLFGLDVAANVPGSYIFVFLRS